MNENPRISVAKRPTANRTSPTSRNIGESRKTYIYPKRSLLEDDEFDVEEKKTDTQKIIDKLDDIAKNLAKLVEILGNKEDNTKPTIVPAISQQEDLEAYNSIPHTPRSGSMLEDIQQGLASNGYYVSNVVKDNDVSSMGMGGIGPMSMGTMDMTPRDANGMPPMVNNAVSTRTSPGIVYDDNIPEIAGLD